VSELRIDGLPRLFLTSVPSPFAPSAFVVYSRRIALTPNTINVTIKFTVTPTICLRLILSSALVVLCIGCGLVANLASCIFPKQGATTIVRSIYSKQIDAIAQFIRLLTRIFAVSLGTLSQQASPPYSLYRNSAAHTPASASSPALRKSDRDRRAVRAQMLERCRWW
jgi:hypothetical protein